MSPARRLTLSACLLLVCLGTGLRGAAASEGEERDLEPVPRGVVFSDPAQQRPPLDPETDTAIRGEIQRAFASLGSVVEARELIVRRYGLVSVPALRDVLDANRNVTEVWNACLTVAALRDLEGSAFELLPTLKPLVKVLGGSGDPHTNAMAALALGCFHHHQEQLADRHRDAPGRNTPLPGVVTTHRRAAEALREGRRHLANTLEHPHFFLRIAVMFAMAKMGGEAITRDFFAADGAAANPEPRRARVLASAFLGAPDPQVYRKHLLGVEAKAAQTTEEASAALAMAVAMLQEQAPDWTRDADDVLRHLRGTGVAQPAAGAERIFGIGVCAHVNQATAAWDDVWDAATRATADEKVVAAASQILVHCRIPAVERRMIDLLVKPSKTPHLPVLAMVLLRGGMAGNADALPEVCEWLRTKSRRPAAKSSWDPRWYAVVGLLRALNQGHIKSVAERTMVIEALRKAASNTLDKDAGIRAPLQAMLAVHGDKLATSNPSALYLLPRAELERVERGFACPYGLLARDPVDACVDRVNAMVADIFGLRNVPPWKPGGDNSKYQPQRYLKRYLARYPYFSRLEFRIERGRRAEPALRPDDQGIDR